MICFYKVIQIILVPVVFLMLIIRLLKGKEDRKRIFEKFGCPSAKRFKTKKLIWLHAASVGESLCIMTLVDKLCKDPKLQILVTTGTVTSAKLMAKKLNKKAVHQYVPLDYTWFVKKFFKYWKPDLSVFVESDLWPNLVMQAPNKILINARMSDRSLNRYLKIPSYVKSMLGGFEVIFAQSKQDQDRFSKLSDVKVINAGNLKYDGLALSYKKNEYEVFKSTFSDRKIVLFSSTHATEDEKFLDIYKNLKKEHSNLMAILTPRHPHRADDIEKIIAKENLTYTRRTKNRGLDSSVDIYLADTIGEMGLWNKLADVVFIGGSLIEHGGQSPLDALKASKFTICGPDMSNFKEIMSVLTKSEVSVIAKDLDKMQEYAKTVLSDDYDNEQLKLKTKKVLAKLTGATSTVSKFISKRV